MSSRAAIFILLLAICFSCGNRSKRVFRIVFDSSGCFTYEQSEFIVYKEGLTFIAHLETKGQKDRDTIVGEGYGPIISQFVKELKALKNDGGCTTVDIYTVYVDGKIIKKTDGSCNWNGFRKITGAFFPDMK